MVVFCGAIGDASLRSYSVMRGGGAVRVAVGDARRRRGARSCR